MFDVDEMLCLIRRQKEARIGALAAESQEIHEKIVGMMIRTLGKEALFDRSMQEMDLLLLSHYERQGLKDLERLPQRSDARSPQST